MYTTQELTTINISFQTFPFFWRMGVSLLIFGVDNLFTILYHIVKKKKNSECDVDLYISVNNFLNYFIDEETEAQSS